MPTSSEKSGNLAMQAALAVVMGGKCWLGCMKQFECHEAEAYCKIERVLQMDDVFTGERVIRE